MGSAVAGIVSIWRKRYTAAIRALWVHSDCRNANAQDELLSSPNAVGAGNVPGRSRSPILGPGPGYMGSDSGRMT